MRNPFDLNDHDAYQRWREHKLAHAITDLNQFVVEIDDPAALTPAEHAALLSRCQRSNMAIYTTRRDVSEPDIKALGEQFGLHRLDANWLADDLGITRITVCQEEGQRQAYIPYTNRPIKWHTDGYYNPPERQIRAMVLHCAHDAAQGGENRLLDHEIAYLLLRDADPQYVQALCAPDAMIIPANTEDRAAMRPAQAGPVFSADGGALHMRYTARTRSVEWRPDEATRAAVQFLQRLLDSGSPYVFTLRLAAGQGLVCNNVLHDRSAFADPPAPSPGRLVYRARYSDRIAPA